MNKNIEKLLNLIKENPDLPIVPMVDYGVVAGDSYCYWQGSFGNCEVTKMYKDNGRIWLEDNFDDLVNKVFCNYDSEVENEKVLEKYAKNVVENYPWEKVIVVYIELL